MIRSKKFEYTQTHTHTVNAPAVLLKEWKVLVELGARVRRVELGQLRENRRPRRRLLGCVLDVRDRLIVLVLKCNLGKVPTQDSG